MRTPVGVSIERGDGFVRHFHSYPVVIIYHKLEGEQDSIYKHRTGLATAALHTQILGIQRAMNLPPL